MPSAQKVAWAKMKVGILGIVAMTLLGFLIFLLTGDKDLFARNATIYTFLDDSAAMEIGSPVRLNGIVIGKVSKVSLSGLRVPGKTIRVDMEVPEKVLRDIPVDSVAAISAENVLGTKYINISRGVSTQTMQPQGTVSNLDTKEFSEVVQSGYAVLTSFQGILNRIDIIVSQIESGKGSIGKLLVSDELYDRLVATVAEAQKVTEALSSGRGTLGRLLYDDSLYQEVRAPIARLDNLMQGLQEGRGTAGKLLKDPALYNELRQTSSELHRLVADLNAGKGSAGKFLKSDQLNNQLSETITKLDTTLDRINSGQGTLGQLLVNPSLYENLNGATHEMHGLMKDFRANPKKFLRIKMSLF